VTSHPAARLAGGAAHDLAERATGVGVVGIGIDAVDLDRFRAVLARRPGLERRLFSDAERAYANGAADPLPRLATRFAAKEAVMKALGVGLWSFALHDVEVLRTGDDAPGLVLNGTAADLAEQAGVTRWHLSLSHTDRVALAAVVADGGAAGRDGAPGPDAAAGPAVGL
jgi:holo-[acyl-carrier protein] synthase